MNDMYEKVLALIVKSGDELTAMAGDIEDIGVSKKWVTKKDIEIEENISKLVATFEGTHKVYAEELHDEFIEADNVWIIDPISNTRGFIEGWHHYGVVVSHLKDGVLQFGAVYDPSVKELFTAYKGKGAFLNGKPIHVGKRTEDLGFIFTPRIRGKFDKNWNLKLIASILDISSFGNVGSVGIQYCYVACGRADCAITINKDTFPEFAGKIILEEAGGIMTDFDGNNLKPETTGIIATRKDLHAKLLKFVQ